jgi:hypothetical protein
MQRPAIIGETLQIFTEDLCRCFVSPSSKQNFTEFLTCRDRLFRGLIIKQGIFPSNRLAHLGQSLVKFAFGQNAEFFKGQCTVIVVLLVFVRVDGHDTIFKSSLINP